MTMLVEKGRYGYLVNEAEYIRAIVEHTDVSEEDAARLVWGRQQKNPLPDDQIEAIEKQIADCDVVGKLCASLPDSRRELISQYR